MSWGFKAARLWGLSRLAKLIWRRRQLFPGYQWRSSRSEWIRPKSCLRKRIWSLPTRKRIMWPTLSWFRPCTRPPNLTRNTKTILRVLTSLLTCAPLDLPSSLRVRDALAHPGPGPANHHEVNGLFQVWEEVEETSQGREEKIEEVEEAGSRIIKISSGSSH